MPPSLQPPPLTREAGGSKEEAGAASTPDPPHPPAPPVHVPHLFQRAGLAILGWALMIFLPTWRATRFLARGAVFPVYLSLVYAVGIVPLVVAAGPGIMADFGSVEGVLGLLADPDVALIAWIHILAFDHLVGVLIYRDNLAHRFVPFPVLSVVLFLTLMLGPVGFLARWGIRGLRIRRLGGGPSDALTLGPEAPSGRPPG